MSNYYTVTQNQFKKKRVSNGVKEARIISLFCRKKVYVRVTKEYYT